MLMTAAGTVLPARVFVLGAGVAGLQAVATARRLGAVVSAFDIRPTVKEQVESLGARFVGADLDQHAEDAKGYAKEVSADTARKEKDLLLEEMKGTDACITTALVPGKRAPVLVTAQMVEAMRPGSVVVDLAAEQGGNCELAEAGKEVVPPGVDGRPVRLRAGRVPRLSGHLAGPASAAHATDVGDQRDLRDLAGGIAGRRGGRVQRGQHAARLRRRHRIHHQRGGRVPHHRS